MGATVATALSLASPQPANAHLGVQPRLVEQGDAALAIELPRLRPGAAPVQLQLESPGVRVVSSRQAGLAGAESRWIVRVRIDSPPGPLDLDIRAVYADGKSVEVDASITVLPASDESSGRRWWLVVTGGLLAAAIGIAALRTARRKAW